jgi:ubiquinone/menaquinone biosynthesis C-methylase UbiE
VSTAPYDELAGRYARHRRPCQPIVDRLVAGASIGPAATVLEVGCGTANHLAAIRRRNGARCEGVDPSAEMLRYAACHDVDLALRQGRAEELILSAGTYQLIFSVDVLHHIRQPDRYLRVAFAALRPGGWLCTATDSPWTIRNRLLSRYFPATVAVELARYHPIASLQQALRQAGFTDVGETVVQERYTVTSATSFQDKAYSCLHLIPDQAFQAGLDHLRRDLAEGPVEGVWRSCLLWGRRPVLA